MSSIQIARSDADIARCFAVMKQLRPELQETEFVGRVRLQEKGGYSLAFLEDDGEVRAAAGFRFIDNLVRGRVLYVDDLVTDAAHRSRGHGAMMMTWLVGRAKSERCRSLELDSGVQRFEAHRFYLANRMIISSHHFRLPV